MVRLGSPPNPNALLPGLACGPVICTSWQPAVDHTSFVPAAVLDVLILAALPDNAPSPFGTVLCDLASAPPVLLTSPPGVPFAVPVPGQCSLVGQGLCAQAASVDAFGIALTNALDLTIGG